MDFNKIWKTEIAKGSSKPPFYLCSFDVGFSENTDSNVDRFALSAYSIVGYAYIHTEAHIAPPYSLIATRNDPLDRINIKDFRRG